MNERKSMRIYGQASSRSHRKDTRIEGHGLFFQRNPTTGSDRGGGPKVENCQTDAKGEQ